MTMMKRGRPARKLESQHLAGFVPSLFCRQEAGAPVLSWFLNLIAQGVDEGVRARIARCVENVVRRAVFDDLAALGEYDLVLTSSAKRIPASPGGWRGAMRLLLLRMSGREQSGSAEAPPVIGVRW
jgi:hypothetical protein